MVFALGFANVDVCESRRRWNRGRNFRKKVGEIIGPLVEGGINSFLDRTIPDEITLSHTRDIHVSTFLTSFNVTFGELVLTPGDLNIHLDNVAFSNRTAIVNAQAQLLHPKVDGHATLSGRFFNRESSFDDEFDISFEMISLEIEAGASYTIIPPRVREPCVKIVDISILGSNITTPLDDDLEDSLEDAIEGALGENPLQKPIVDSINELLASRDRLCGSVEL